MDGNAIEVLVNLAHHYLSVIESDAEATRAFFVMWGAAIPSEAALRPVFASDDAQFRLGVEAVLRAGQENKTVTTDLDPVLGAVTLVGMLRGVGAQYFIDPEAFDMAAARVACEQFVRRTFAPSGTRAHAQRSQRPSTRLFSVARQHVDGANGAEPNHVCQADPG